MSNYVPAGCPFMESLEQRVLLQGAPFPSLSLLEDPSHTVVRIETTLGSIDFELFDADAPDHVANFLRYVSGGDFGESFLHRSAKFPDESGFALQGGGFRFNEEFQLTTVPTDDPIQNDFGRSNLTRTVAMARQSFQPNSATSQFFINLSDNTFLDTSDNDGFTVFARVLGTAAWDVVQTIVSLNSVDLRNDPAFAGPNQQAFSEVPVTASYNPTNGVDADSIVQIIDVEVIKPGVQSGYFENRLFYPEGFSDATTNETISIFNPGTQRASYQIIARVELPETRTQAQIDAGADFWFRDRVIASGIVNANSRLSVDVSIGPDRASSLVTRFLPYSLELQSTVALHAAIAHQDFEASTGEIMTPMTATTWVFPQAKRGEGVSDFLLWQNPGDQSASVTVTFYLDGASPISLTRTTDMFRRDGLELFSLLSLPDKQSFAIRVDSDVPIVAALTHYDSAVGGSTALGTPGNGSQFAILPGVSLASASSQTLSVFNPGSIAAVVGLTLSFTDPARTPISMPVALLVPPQSRRVFDFASVSQLADGSWVSAQVNANVPVYARTTRSVASDEAAFAVADTAATGLYFADGFMDVTGAGVTLIETISLYNPHNGLFTAIADAAVSVRLRYTDGSSVSHNLTIIGGGRTDVDLHALASVLDAAANGRTVHSIAVESDIPIVGQLWRLNLSPAAPGIAGGFGTLPSLTGAIELAGLTP